MNNWIGWLDIPQKPWKYLNEEEKEPYGIYKIRMVDPGGKPVPIRRFIGVDEEGIIYIGRSGFSDAKSNRSIAKKISEFWIGSHSGGETYRQASQRLGRHKLQVSVKFISGKRSIEREERHELLEYLSKYAELPPCNSSLPRKKVV